MKGEHSLWRARCRVLAAVLASPVPGPWRPVVLAQPFHAMSFTVLDIPGIHR